MKEKPARIHWILHRRYICHHVSLMSLITCHFRCWSRYAMWNFIPKPNIVELLLFNPHPQTGLTSISWFPVILKGWWCCWRLSDSQRCVLIRNRPAARSACQETSVHWQSDSVCHAALVAQQEQDAVDHVVHLYRWRHSWQSRDAIKQSKQRVVDTHLTSKLYKLQKQTQSGENHFQNKSVWPAKRPRGMREVMVLAFSGSLQPTRPISVITTVGFTAFTLIWSQCLCLSQMLALIVTY